MKRNTGRLRSIFLVLFISPIVSKITTYEAKEFQQYQSAFKGCDVSVLMCRKLVKTLATLICRRKASKECQGRSDQPPMVMESIWGPLS